MNQTPKLLNRYTVLRKNITSALENTFFNAEVFFSVMSVSRGCNSDDNANNF